MLATDANVRASGGGSGSGRNRSRTRRRRYGKPAEHQTNAVDSAQVCLTVEVPVVAFDESCDDVPPVGRPGEIVQRGDVPEGVGAEDVSGGVLAASEGRTVEVSV